MTPEQREWQCRLPTIILLTGPMGSGKDYLGRLLVEQAGFVRIAFADALKEEVCAHYGITLDELTARKAEFRPILQNWGVSKREADPYYWIMAWYARVQRADQVDGRSVVCTDCRFPNEALFGIQIGALNVRLVVSEEVRRQRLLQRDGAFDPTWLNHESEQYISQLPVHLELPGDLPDDIILPTLAESYRTLLYGVLP